jgi:hypothetical protein
VSGGCTDNAGNTAADSAQFQYDSTPPANVSTALNRGPDHNGWFNHPVGWTTTGQDSLSGIASCGTGTYNGPDGTGITVSGSCTDQAGNTSAPVGSGSFNYDSTAPTLNPSVSPNPVVLNGSATASPNASDNLSGVDSASCDPVNTGSIGSHTISCTATDKAGNTATKSASYSVNYKFVGFLSPLNSDTTGKVLNVGNAGRTYPIKWQLTDANGNYITDAVSNTTIYVAKVACINVSGDPTDTIDYASSTGGTALRYDSTSNQYIYNWATPSAKGACYRMTVTTPDNQKYIAAFQLK